MGKIPKFNKRVWLAVSAVVVLSLVASFIIFRNQSPEAEAGWWNETWYYRKALEIDYTKIDEELTNFPTAVQFNSNSNIYNNTNSDGSDLRFTDVDGNLLKYEIEKWDETGTSTVWVKVPTIYANASTTFYVYYGNPSAKDAQDPKNVWDDNFVMVQHMGNTATSTGDFVDSTSYNNNGTGAGGESLAATTTGVLDGAFEFDGSNDNIYMPTDPSLSGMSQFTFSAWVFFEQMPATVGSSGGILTKRHNGSPYRSYYFDIRDNCGGGSNRMYLSGTWSGGGQSNWCANTSLATSTWYYVAVTWDGSDVHFYLNGVNDDGGATGWANDYVYISDGNQYINYGSNLDGIIDEARVATVARSAAWLKAEFYNGINTLVNQQTEEQGPGPVAYLSFDEGYGSTTYDQTPNNYDGTINGATWKDDSECKKGKCLYFDELNNDNVELPTNSDILRNVSGATLEAWIKPSTIESSSYGNYIISISVNNMGSAQSRAALYVRESDELGIVARSTDVETSENKATTNSPIRLNEWQHVVGVIDYANEILRFYVNGVLVESISVSFAQNSTPDTTSDVTVIGIDEDKLTDEFDGFIDEVKVYNYVRSADQIKQDYNKGFATYFGSINKYASLSDGLVGWWKMDESSWNGTAGEIVDYSMASNDGTSFGGADTTSTAKFMRAGELDGVDDYASLPHTGGSQITYSMWLKKDFTDYRRAIKKGGGSGTGEFIINFPASGGFGVYLGGGTPSAGYHQTTGIDIGTDTWQHIVWTYDKATLKLYINGELNREIAVARTTDFDAGAIKVGDPYGVTTEDFDGRVDEIRVYNRVLSPDEVRRLYEWAPGPVAYWKFDEFTGTTAYDTAASSTLTGGNHGTLGDDGAGDDVPAWTSGKYGSALLFDGNDSVIIDDSDGLDTPNFTFMAWVLNDEYPVDWNRIAAKKYNFAESDGWEISLVDNSPTEIKIRGSAASPSYQTNCVANWYDGLWHHVAVAFNGSSVSVYCDGVYKGTGSIAPVVANTKDFRIGYIAEAGNMWQGKIDDAKFYNYVRSQRQILEDMNAGRQNNPIGYWSFDEGQGTTANDYGVSAQAGSANNGTLTNMSTAGTSTAWTSYGKVGNALQFDGVDDYVGLSSGVVMNASSSAISLWFRPSSFNTMMVGKNNDSDTYINTLNSTTIRVQTDTVSTYKDFTVPEMSIGTWYHLVVTRDDGTTRVYLNGKESSSGGQTQNPDLTIDQIGRYTNGASGYWYKGMLDEIKIYNYKITLDEIRQNYNQGQQAVLSKSPEEVQNTYEGLVGWWKMDEASWNGTSGEVIDSSRSGHNGTAVNGPTTTSTAKYSRAGYFDGTNDYLSTSGTITAQNGITMEAWIYPEDTAYRSIFRVGNQTGTSGFHWAYLNSSGNLYWQYPNGTNPIAVNCAGCITANTWQHVTITHDYASKSVRYYVNGVLKEIDIHSDNVLPLVDKAVYIGAYINTDGPFKGQIDDLKIYNYARTPDEIMRDYTEGPKPIGYWKMDEMSGTTVVDSSGNGNDLTFLNTPAWRARGKYGSALYFDGTNDGLNKTGVTNLLSSRGTISYWLYLPTKDINNEIFQIYEVAYQDYLVNRINGNNILFFRIEDDNTEYIDLEYDLDNLGNFENQWLHFVWTQDGTGVKLYIDGQEKTLSGTNSGDWWTAHLLNTIYLRLGYNSWGYMTGIMDDFKVFDYALTPRQVAMEYNGGSPVGYWKFDKGEGETAYDYSSSASTGSANNGTVIIGTGGTQTTTSTAWTNGASGKINGSLNFDGTDDWVDLGNTGTSATIPAGDIGYADTDEFTLSVWYKGTDMTGGTYGTGLIGRNNIDFYASLILVSGYVEYLHYDGSWLHNIKSSTLVSDNSWHHIVYVNHSDETGDLYIDGKNEIERLSSSISSATRYFKADELISGYGGYTQGQIDEAKVFNYALTPEEVKKEYNGGFTTYFK